MRIVKPRNVISGFHATPTDAAVPELFHLGEQWVPDESDIPRHAHGVWEFYLQLHGWSVWRDARGGEYRCDAGTLYAPPPDLEHWLTRTSRGKHHFVFAGIDVNAVVSARLKSLKPVWQTSEVVFRRRGESCLDSFRKLIREAASDRPFAEAGLRAAIDTLIVDVSRLAASDRPRSRTLLPIHPAIDAVRNALDAHPAEPWQLSELSKLAGLSPSHLVTLFKSTIGISPHQYLLRRRVEMAEDLLRHSDASITTVAYELGFSSSQHFARVFRQFRKKTASSIRRGRSVALG